MSFNARTTKFAYLLYGALALLVVGALTWGTLATLALEQRELEERRALIQRDAERKLTVAVNQVENKAIGLLASELKRPSREYHPRYFPPAGELLTYYGERVEQSFMSLSPLLLRPPKFDWLLIHFQASPNPRRPSLATFHSPEIVPDDMRSWDLDDDYDAATRERYRRVFADLQSNYALMAELTELYGQSATTGADTPSPDGTEEPASGASARKLVAAGAGSADRATRTQSSTEIASEDFTLRQQSAALAQSESRPGEVCVTEMHVHLNIFGSAPEDEDQLALFASMETKDEIVGIRHSGWRPVWVDLPGRDEPDLAYLQGVYASGDPDVASIYGFIVDWPRFRDELLTVARQTFPDADIEPLRAGVSEATHPVMGTRMAFLPARLVSNTPLPMLVEHERSASRTMLLLGWSSALVVLVGLGLGIRSLITVFARRSEFAYAVTHELRTPLTTFRLYTDMLAGGLVDEANKQEYLVTLNKESERLADLVSGVLEYSRVENNSVAITKAPATVASLLTEVRRLCGQRCEDSGVALELDSDSVGTETVETDRRLTAQILGNLVDNACKYGRGERSDPTVRIEARRENGSILFDVVDHGPGVPSRLRHSIFKPYRRGDDGNTPATGGIGLGLALSRSWARLLGGHLELIVSDHATAGARFRLSLPSQHHA